MRLVQGLLCGLLSGLLPWGVAIAASENVVAERLPTIAGNFPWFHAGPAETAAVRRILIILHGHARDLDDSLSAGLRVVEQTGLGDVTQVVAPLFPVPAPASAACSRPQTPPFVAGDAGWRCASWQEGGLSTDGTLSAFEAMNALLAELKRRWPGAQRVTLAGFSAGGQFVQHYAGLARIPAGMTLRFVVADPGSWLYPDDRRPQAFRDGKPVDWRECTAVSGEGACDYNWAVPEDCPAALAWKYGLRKLPAELGQNAEALRERLAAADIVYLEGALDTGEGRASYYRILDKSCGAQAQGPYRLQRGLAFAAHERAFVRPAAPRPLIVVPGCAHEPACVLTSPAALPYLLPQDGMGKP